MQFREIESQLSGKSPKEALRWLDEKFGSRVKLSSALGPEAQLISYWISSQQLATEIFTIDTGRLFQETHDLIELTNALLKTNIKVYYPDNRSIEELVSSRGPNSFYHSVEDRIECCHVRKVMPLKRALTGAAVWVTGLRADQSKSRNHMKMLEWNDTYGVIKFNPLFHWTGPEVLEEIKKFNIPVNQLHHEGYVSIGCQPCTRAIGPGEDERAGRWWWETSSKECGLHEHFQPRIKETA